ncbi:MAG: hypothetical protein QG593_630 [Patescibacteria group bacterium]|jgi:hypothetical protein|nr:hypothetical protein [Patescibacteria group bacterium]
MIKNVFYYSGLPHNQKPGKQPMYIKKSYIKLAGHTINYSDIKNIDVKYEIGEKNVSAGKAIAGGVLFGGVGAVLGGMSGGKKVDTYLIVSYVSDGQPYDLILTAIQTNVVKVAIEKRWKKSKSASVVEPSEPVAQIAKPKKSLLYWYFTPYRWLWNLVKPKSRRDS